LGVGDELFFYDYKSGNLKVFNPVQDTMNKKWN